MACRLANRAIAEQLVKARVGIGLQNTLEASQVTLGMNALPVGRVREPYGGRLLRSGPMVIAYVDKLNLAQLTDLEALISQYTTNRSARA
jgi:hypothetical protein